MTVENPVGAYVDEEVVCRNCLKMEEEISMMRGFIDAISEEEAKEKDLTCTRCDKKIASKA